MEKPRYEEFAVFFNKLIKHYSDKQGQEFLAKLLMTTQPTISKIMKGNALPNEDMVKQIDVLWNIDISEEVDKAKRKFEQSKNISKMQKTSNPNVVSITKPRLPVYAAAGRLSVYVDGVMRSECEEMPIIRSMPNYDFTMFIKGNSMEPKYESGDEIALKEVTSIIEWGKDYVLDTEDGPVFKKIYDDGENIRCVSYNREEYPDFFVPKSAVYGYYRFVGLIRV